MEQIKFGTDGWRALIARDFTFDNVTLVSKAVVAFAQKQSPRPKRIVVGYDRRFLSRQFAETAATVCAQGGLEVLMSKDYYPTPTLSWCAKQESDCVGAIVITASHNPPEWNGFKFKEPFGGSAHPDTTAAFEKATLTLALDDPQAPSSADFSQAVTERKIKMFDPMEAYLSAVRNQIDVETIAKAKLKVGVDSMYGSGAGHYKKLLESVGVEVVELHSDCNPGFNGTPPEPIGKNLPELSQLVKREKLACGLATDGDADRLGAIDEEGEPFTTQMILSVAYWHMLTHREKRWNISRSASTTRMVDLIAERAGLKCLETPVGFKYIADLMVKGQAQIGGEESGGIGIMDHIPERDGLLTGLLLLEVMAKTGKGLKALYEQLCREYRPYYFIRHDLHVDQGVMDRAMKRLQTRTPSEWDGRTVKEVSRIDGFKFYMEDGSWILIRASGTEPIFRLYAEMESLAASQKMIDCVRKYVESA